MRNGIDTITEFLIWTVGIQIQTNESLRNWEGPRTYVFKRDDEFVKIRVK
jgi:hypothetical protein